MPKRYKKVLLHEPFRFRHRNLDGSHKDFTTPLLFYRPNGQLVMRFAGDRQVTLMPVNENTGIEQDALNWIKHRINNIPPIQYQAEVGDIIIVDNDAVLHGRSAMSQQGGSHRLVRRVYLECPHHFTGLEHI
ncbi:MAG: TauD/TfdA family dioxygenase [Cyanobacteria bacterium P01_F01_bin.150]